MTDGVAVLYSYSAVRQGNPALYPAGPHTGVCGVYLAHLHAYFEIYGFIHVVIVYGPRAACKVFFVFVIYCTQ